MYAALFVDLTGGSHLALVISADRCIA